MSVHVMPRSSTLIAYRRRAHRQKANRDYLHFFRFFPPAQRVGRAQPRAEAEGRCPGFERRSIQCGLKGRERFCADRPSFRFRFSRPFRPRVCRVLLTQGIGLRPQPWAPFSRPVGPAGPARNPMCFAAMDSSRPRLLASSSAGCSGYSSFWISPVTSLILAPIPSN